MRKQSQQYELVKMEAYFPMAEGAVHSNWSLVCEEKQGQTTRRRAKREREQRNILRVWVKMFFFPPMPC